MSTEPEGKSPVEERVVRPNQVIPWVVVVGNLVTGVIGVGAALGALNSYAVSDGMRYVGVGACLAAAALAFGLLSNAIFRR